jgi:hypothetical protein
MESIVHGSRGGPAAEWRQSRLHHWFEQDGTENDRERGRLEDERGRAPYMVAMVGQQENGDRADSTTAWLEQEGTENQRERGSQ